MRFTCGSIPTMTKLSGKHWGTIAIIITIVGEREVGGRDGRGVVRIGGAEAEAEEEWVVDLCISVLVLRDRGDRINRAVKLEEDRQGREWQRMWYLLSLVRRARR